MSEETKVIPINIQMIRALERAMTVLSEKPWQGPKEFNAIFIDRKEFMKMGKVPNPPPPHWEFALFPKMRWEISPTPPSSAPEVERVRFDFYRRVGDTIEYREY